VGTARTHHRLTAALAAWRLAGAVALSQAQLYNISRNFAGEVVVIHAVVDTEDDDSHDGFSARPDSGIVPQMEGAALMQAFGFDAQNAGMRPAPQTPVLVYCFAFAGHLEVRARSTGAGGWRARVRVENTEQRRQISVVLSNRF
jgi:hypothetical protein